MTAVLQHRRYGTLTRLGFVPADGELVVDTGILRLFVGDGATTGGLQVDGIGISVQGGTSFSITADDVGTLITSSNGSPVAVSLGEAGSASGSYFPARTYFFILVLGGGAVTITPTTSTINGAGTLVLNQNDAALVVSDGTNYFALVSRTSGDGTVPVSSHTGDYSVLAADSGTHFDNIGAAGTVIFSLPSVAAGLSFGFLVSAAQTVRVAAAGSEQIAIGGTNSAAGGNVESNTPFSFIQVESHGVGQWVASSSVGSWTVN